MKFLALAIGGIVLLGLWSALMTTSAPPSARPILQITGARGASGITFTNKETGELDRCTIAVLDGHSEWFATLDGRVLPSQTVSIDWAAFKQNGQSLPGYLGRSKNNVVVSCFMDGNTNERRNAGLHF